MEKYAKRLIIEYSDGSTEDFDTFIAAVASGLIPTGKDSSSILYTAGEDFATLGMAHVAATPEVAVGLIVAFQEVVSRLIKNMPPDIIPNFLEAFLSLDHKTTEHYHESRSIEPKQG